MACIHRDSPSNLPSVHCYFLSLPPLALPRASPFHKGSDDPGEYLGSDLQEDLANLQLLYGLLWAQLTEKLPLVTTLINCIGERLRRVHPLLVEICGDDAGTSSSSSSAASTKKTGAGTTSSSIGATSKTKTGATSATTSFQASSTPFLLMQTAMAVQKRMIERCLVIENQPGPLVKKERRTTVRVRLLLNPKHLPIGLSLGWVFFFLRPVQ